MIVAGADEAGRGCVLGPLVLCIAACPREAEGRLRALGARDSKQLSPSSRERIARHIRSLCSLIIIKITARELNSLMRKHSLNEIEAMRLGEALNSLNCDEVFIDSPDPQPEKFAKRIRRYYRGSARIVCENRADARYVVVGAASIIAKVERDADIERIKRELGHDFGSGYSSDPRTMAFLKENWQRPAVRKYLRSEWETVGRLRQRKLTEEY
ncbi:MAG: ribonuclease HII [Candidatus Micrarchaeia archaeon]